MNPSTKKMLDDIGMSEEFRIRFGLSYVPMSRHSVIIEKDTVVTFSGQDLPTSIFRLANPMADTPVARILYDLGLFESITMLSGMDEIQSGTSYPKTAEHLRGLKGASIMLPLEGYQAIDFSATDRDGIVEAVRACQENARIAKSSLSNKYTANDFKEALVSHGFSPLSQDHEAWKSEFENGLNFTHTINRSLDLIVPAGARFEFIRGNSTHRAYEDYVILEIGEKRKVCTMNVAGIPPGEKPLEFYLLSHKPRFPIMTGFRDLLPFETPETLSYKQEPDTLQ